MIKNLKKVILGLILCIFLGVLANLLGKFFPSFGAAPIAIVLGLICGNTIFKSSIFEKGAKFAENDLLSYSIVLLGGTLSLKSITGLGIKGVLFIFLQMSLTILVTITLGKKLGFSREFQSLMASGNAVCGSSAIGAVAPVIGANKTDKGISITIVNLTGTLLMFLLIPITSFFFHFQTIKTSAFLGGILQSMGQVVAAGSLVNLETQEMAIIFKILRIIFLIFVLMIFAKRHRQDESHTRVKKSKFFLPWYIIGFFILCFLYSFGFVSTDLSKFLKILSNKFEIVALAGIGMRIKISDLISQGFKLSLYGFLVASTQILIALFLISFIF